MNITDNFNSKKNLFIKKENIVVIILIIVLFSLDRTSKIQIINNFSERVYLINDFINFDLTWNTGIGFGLLSFDSSLIYNSITVFIGLVILFLIYLAINSANAEKLIFSTIIGGAIGNFYDRLIYNAVPDFIDLHYNGFHWFTFNVADIFITLAIILYIMKNYFVKMKDKNEKN
jgi:signal peptidase II